ncbi:hypothetical protein [Mesorhizobium sp. M0488]|uniref:hypothetical protein n=1 Tax=unclassified Mesorhizobium TaxID=325217 RepID=UPI00333D6B7C
MDEVFPDLQFLVTTLGQDRRDHFYIVPILIFDGAIRDVRAAISNDLPGELLCILAPYIGIDGRVDLKVWNEGQGDICH